MGKPFHQYYFDLAAKNKELGATTAPPLPGISTMMSPKVRMSGDMAVVTYVRAVQTAANSVAGTSFSAESRVWQKHGGTWLCVHMHRSSLAETWP